MLDQALKFIDWFIPDARVLERSDLSVARNFIFTHLIGPLMTQPIGVFLYYTDPNPGIACTIMILCINSFWILPFLYKSTGNIKLSALISVQLLMFTALFGTFFYGGIGSPFLPWLIVAILLGFFYLTDKATMVFGLICANLAIFIGAYLAFGFPELVPLSKLAAVGWISIFSATVYMAWMAIYYANVMSMRSEVEQETDRHRATAEQLQEAKKMADDANHAKSIFLAKMSHEFRTPLNAVIGYSELIMEMIEPSTTSEQKQKDLRRINAAGNHLLSLVTDVLDLAKIESDTVELKSEAFDLDAFCDQVLSTTRPQIRQNNNTLTVQRPSKLGQIVTDQTKLRQIVLNLLSNAAKFTENGTITLQVRRQTNMAGDWIEFQVRDSGIGISQEDLPRLFQNYRQASAKTSGKYGGTGLGLSISQKLCNLMGGGISVVSEVGRGSNFTVRIPAISAQESSQLASKNDTFQSEPALALSSMNAN